MITLQPITRIVGRRSFQAGALQHRSVFFKNIFRSLSVAALCTVISACAALPDVRYLNTTLAAPATPTITSSQGNLGIAKTNSLLPQRWHNSHMDVKALAALEEAATGSPLISGNKVTLLYDGPQTMAAMIAAITAAKDNINLETYIFDQDEMGMRFADALIAKQREGVQVNIIYDGVGTIGTPKAFFDKMHDAGIHLLEFHPVNPLANPGRWQLNNRDHRKILIVDGTIAFTGGVNISKTYANSSLFHSMAKNKSKVGWRDTHIKIEGPAVASLQWVFLDNWVSQQGGDLPDSQFFPTLKEAGDKVVRVLASHPDGNFEIYKAYILAIQQAKKSIHITAAYFVPDEQILHALEQAAQRGVEVRLVLPSVTDSGLVFHAAQSFYSEMLASGIKIHQLQVSVLHAKTAVIDGVWSTVGSTNMDTRSFLHNNEVNVIVLGEEFGRSMESAFQEDLRDSSEITKEKWKQRPLNDHLKEWAARALDYWL